MDLDGVVVGQDALHGRAARFGGVVEEQPGIGCGGVVRLAAKHVGLRRHAGADTAGAGPRLSAPQGLVRTIFIPFTASRILGCEACIDDSM